MIRPIAHGPNLYSATLACAEMCMRMLSVRVSTRCAGWYIGTAPSVPGSPTPGRARNFWREVTTSNHSCAYTKKWHITRFSLLRSSSDFHTGHTYLPVFRGGQRDQTLQLRQASIPKLSQRT
ncbi:hypothetical protein BDW62DRAFT_194248 [Aspergillus aurantiobrunneus]